MKYFRKTKFRESSLIKVALFVAIVYFTTNIISYEQSKDVQELIDARVEEALKEATTTTFPNNTTTTTSPYPFEYDSILIGYVTDVRLNDRGKVTGILISEMLWTGPGSSVQLYRNNRKIDEWDFKIGDHVVAVLVGPMLTSDPAHQAASRIYIINEFKPEFYLPEN